MILRGLPPVLLVNLLLVGPEWLMPYAAFPHPWLAAEVLLVCGIMLFVPGPWAWLSAAALSLAVMVSVALALSDLGTGLAFGRPMNLLIDLPLAASVEHLLRGAVGGPAAWVILATGGVAAGYALYRLARLLVGMAPRQVGLAPVLMGLVLVGGGLLLQHHRDAWPIGRAVDAPALIRYADQADRIRRTAAERRAFADALAVPQKPVERRMANLQGRDVILGFIESYGVSFLRDLRYRDTGKTALGYLADQLQAAGLQAVTTTMRSPVQGGQSWLAHGSVLSGRWINNQIRYDLFLDKPRPSLIRDFAQAGYETAAVMPAITRAWPAGVQWGYDQIHDHARIEYAGPPLNWVTMPDQYTWHYFQRAIRAPSASPVFAELALISSHAPWTPVLPTIDWSRVDDGSVFQRWAEAGPTPGMVWADRDRVRRHYARAVDYALRTAGEWAARNLDDGILILLGDHQPAPLVTGEGASRAVPVHIIARDSALLEAFVARGFRRGVMPPAKGLGTLADLRSHLLAVFDGRRTTGAVVPAPAPGGVAPSPQQRKE
jgi:hypothetical protein